jgi:hypothetical protein
MASVGSDIFKVLLQLHQRTSPISAEAYSIYNKGYPEEDKGKSGVFWLS